MTGSVWIHFTREGAMVCRAPTCRYCQRANPIEEFVPAEPARRRIEAFENAAKRVLAAFPLPAIFTGTERYASLKALGQALHDSETGSPDG